MLKRGRQKDLKTDKKTREKHTGVKVKGTCCLRSHFRFALPVPAGQRDLGDNSCPSSECGPP